MKSVLITGGTTRLGAAIADGLKAAGWQVLTSSHRPDAAADFTVDFSQAGAPARLYAEVIRRLGGRPPDALVNNAALFAGSEEVLQAVDFDAPRKLTVMMAAREGGRGAVVNIIDTRVLRPASEGEGAYAAAKRRLLEFTRSAAALYGDTISVNAVAPGPVMASESVRERAGEMIAPRPRAEEVAAAVAFLLAAPSVTGAVVPVDGGQHLL